MLKKLVLLIAAALIMMNCSEKPNFSSMNKMDAHVHIETNDDAFVTLAGENNFTLFSIVTSSESRAKINTMLDWIQPHAQSSPGIVNYATAFSIENFGEPDWEQNTIQLLKRDFDQGAIAVKVWKDIGMTFRDRDGSFIMIDDPRFDPIFDFIAEQGKALVAHIGEPKNCWLPLDSMTTNNDRKYFSRHPEYHMFLHPEYPSYDDQITARDNVLARHPNLNVIGCHLGSLEWDVAEIAKRLDAYPNFAVDTSARQGHLQVQDREKVRQFIIDYQDRIMYGTDIGVEGDISQDQLDGILKTWQADWRYYSTKDTLTSNTVKNKFVGLKLPASVLEKLYFTNAKTWLRIQG
jgi:predicted TIM-barrel fold metal-dependent hydrolase